MRAAFSKTEIESEITSRFGSAFKLHEKRPAEVISTGLCEVDSFIGGGLPRGSITEVFGPASSGRTSFMLAALAHATERQEVCALVDTSNAFDPKSASQAEINFERLLKVVARSNPSVLLGEDPAAVAQRGIIVRLSLQRLVESVGCLIEIAFPLFGYSKIVVGLCRIRAQLNDHVAVVFNRAKSPAKVDITVAPEMEDGDYADALSGKRQAAESGKCESAN